MRYERAELLYAFRALTNNEKPTLALLAAFMGIVLTTTFVALMSQYFLTCLFVSALVFPAIIAQFSRKVARLHTAGARIPVALVVGAAYLILGFVFQPQVLWFLLTLVPISIVYIASDIKLSRMELYAVDEHIIRPFTIEFPSHRKLLIVPIIFSLIFFIVCNLILKKMDQGCLSDIKNQDHKVILLNCAFYKDNLIEPNSLKEHKFGSYFLPTQEARLIQSKAESGKIEFQYIWWFIQDKIYRNDFSVIRRVGKEKYDEQVESWLILAATGGNAEAKKAYITKHLNRQLSTEEQKQLALKFANELDSLGIPEAKDLIKNVDNKTTREDVLAMYYSRLKNLESLSFEELKIVLHAVQQGDYFYDLKEFNENVFDSRNVSNRIEVSIDTEKALNILKVMSEKFQNADASFQIFNLLQVTSEPSAMSYLRKAAEQNHVRAAGLLGEHIFCNDERLDGLSWLSKAAKLGDKIAKRQLAEITRTKQLIDCSL